jgi:hypothetical protein
MRVLTTPLSFLPFASGEAPLFMRVLTTPEAPFSPRSGEAPLSMRLLTTSPDDRPLAGARLTRARGGRARFAPLIEEGLRLSLGLLQPGCIPAVQSPGAVFRAVT